MAVKKKAVAKRGTSKNLPANIDAELEAEAKNIGSTITNIGGDFIKVDQDNAAFFEIPGMGQAETPMEVVVVDYRAVNMLLPDYVEGTFQPPSCWAHGKEISKLAPNEAVPDPEAESCSECPNNEFGSKGKGKACKNTFLLAVLPPDADEDEELRYISVSPTGLKSFSAFVAGVANRYSKPPVGAVVSMAAVKAGKGATVSFGKYRPNEHYKTHYMRRPEAQPVLEQDFTPASETEKKAAPKKKVATRKRRARA